MAPKEGIKAELLDQLLAGQDPRSCLGYFLERDKQPRLRSQRPEGAPALVGPDLGGSVCATGPPGVRSTASDTGEEVVGE